MKHGSTIDSFLKEVQKEFPELRGTSSSDLMYIKEVSHPHHPHPILT